MGSRKKFGSTLGKKWLVIALFASAIFIAYIPSGLYLIYRLGQNSVVIDDVRVVLEKD